MVRSNQSSRSNSADLEKDVSVSSETEASHTAHAVEDGDPVDHDDPVVFQQGGKKVASLSCSKRSIIYSVAILAVLGLVVVLPSVLVVKKNRNKSNSINSNVASSLAIDLEEDPDSEEIPPKKPTTTMTTPTLPTTLQYDFDTFEYTAEDNEQCPGHLEGEYWEVSQVWAFDLSLGQRGTTDDRTFAVEPRHTSWEDGSGSGVGVVFNIETVPEPLPEDLAKPILSSTEVHKRLKEEASEFYQNTTAAMSYPVPPLPNVTLEVVSKDDDGDDAARPLIYAGNQGFLAGCMMAFAQHLPLALKPDHIWTIIAQGFAHHVDQNAEALRGNFVDHQGKVEIKIREDRMRRGESSPEQWEELIFPRFSEEIGKNMNNPEAYETLSKKVFSTSDATSQAASEIVLMSALKEFFEYTMVTACGIPEIRLEGTREDWVALRDRAAKLSKWMMPNSTHGELWITDIVLPILDQFLLAYDGHVNYCFWQTMVKFRSTGGGSGSYEFLSGWLPTLFPYLSMGEGQTKPNPFLRSWQESASALHEGPKPTQIPSQVSSVPVKWEYFHQEVPLHFHAGFRGITQEADGTLSPVLGWYVTNDPEEQ